ncbi:SIMPL domain-containing protein [Nitrogeniibacter mangrovi]|uniref:SIMPL domain-containing protein n=1 Tax=Nitrogeniibacter mangrovi TaxID=2016596 RepID=A0A6C1B6L2_9RHOO|nr:SIMPL domain-containing protein [Nitrogeniibacter mangrovi]QID17884.1 SIMPL domain-containing protein [Nitrogeniibacter mangrovi]
MLSRINVCRWCAPLLAVCLLLALPTRAGAQELPTVNLSADGQAEADNDLARAEAYAEATGDDPRQVSAEVNRRIADALAVAKRYPTVTVQTAQTATWPVYAKNSRTISAWRMRSALSIESRDTAAFSACVGALQATLAIGNLSVVPSPETLAAAEDAATLAAIDAFGKRAEMVAKALGHRYRIKTLNVGTQRGPTLVLRAAMAADRSEMSAPAPVEAGRSHITIQVNGTIELLDKP